MVADFLRIFFISSLSLFQSPGFNIAAAIMIWLQWRIKADFRGRLRTAMIRNNPFIQIAEQYEPR